MAPSAVSRTASLKRAEFFAALLKLKEPRPNIVRDALHLVPDRQDARRFFRDREFHDGRSREEADKLRPHEEFARRTLASDVKVARQNDPLSLGRESGDPFFVRDMGVAKFVAMTDDLMVPAEKRIEPASEVGREIVVNEDLQ